MINSVSNKEHRGGIYSEGRTNIHIKKAVVDEQLLEFKGNLNGDVVRNLKEARKMTKVVSLHFVLSFVGT